MNFTGAFLQGIQANINGVKFFYAHRDLWKYALVPWLFVVIFYALFIAGAFLGMNALTESLRASMESLPAWLSWLGSLVSAAGVAAVIAVAALTVVFFTSTVYELFGGLFFDALIARIELNESGVKLPENSWSFNLRIVADTFRYTLGTLLWMVLTLFINLIPLIGPVISFFIISYRFGVTYLSITTFRYGMTLFQAQQKLNGNRAAVLGYGAAINLVYLIPGAVFILLPGIITGGVLLARDLKLLNINAR